MTATAIILILLIHWFADFVMQNDKIAQGKSKNWTDLLSHTVVYSSIWLIPACILIGTAIPGKSTEFYVSSAIWFCVITFICHTATDYFTSRLNRKLLDGKKVHWFFVSIGFDQWLHYIQLILTYKFFISY